MDGHRSSRDANRRRWHSLVERYTPDGSLGRFLLGASTGAVGIWLLGLLLFEVTRWGLSLAALFWAPVLFGIGLPAATISLVVLWPLYLSLIGNIESPSAYSVAGTNERPRTDASGRNSATDRDDPPDEEPLEASPNADVAADAEKPLGDLKRQYANGDISEEEFERRLESRLQDGTAPSTASATDDGIRERTPDRH